MKLNITFNDNIIRIEFVEIEVTDIELTLNESINLTNFIIKLSNSGEAIEANPDNEKEFIDQNNIKNEFDKKVISYIYKIIEEYNKCFNSIFLIEENKEEVAVVQETSM